MGRSRSSGARAGALGAKTQSRRVGGYLHFKALHTALERHVSAGVTSVAAVRTRRSQYGRTPVAVIEIPRP
jgi:hypothetical protein